MTTWTIRARKPEATGATSPGFDDSVSDTGLRFDDSVNLKSWCPAGSTATLRVQRLLARLQADAPNGWKYEAFDGAATTVQADYSGGGQTTE